MSSIFNDPEWEQQRKEILTNWARRDGEVKVDMGETEEYMPAEEFLALRQKYPNGNMRLSEPQEAVKVFKDKGWIQAEKNAWMQEPIFINGKLFEKKVEEIVDNLLEVESIYNFLDKKNRDRNTLGGLFSRGFDEAGEMINQDFSGNFKAAFNPLTLKDMASSLYTMGKLYYGLPKSMNDKEKHFIISCEMAKKSPMMSTVAGYGKEVLDQFLGSNTLEESHKDLDADRAGRLYGINNPNGSCYVGAKKYRESLKK